MDKKKLIGTIIGVAMFAALIAGATFAFLSFNATVTTATYNGKTMNFIVDYTKGTAITYIPQFDADLSNYASRLDPDDANKKPASLVVVAKHHDNSAKGYVSVKLTTSSTGTLTTGGLIYWVICRDPDVESGTQVDDVCGTGFPTGTLSAGQAIHTGTISAKGTVTLMSDAALAVGTSKVTPENTSTVNNDYLLYYDESTKVHNDYSYFVYFWIDSEKITNTHINQSYSGYIHASATQLEN